MPKVIPKKNKEETAIRQQLSLEKFKTVINLQKVYSFKHFQTLDANMITLQWITITTVVIHSSNYWKKAARTNSRNQSTFLTQKGIGIIITSPRNSVTTLRKENLKKQIKKAMIITLIEEHKIVEGKIDIEVVKIKTEPEVLVKKEQLTKGLHNKIRKTI